jgi:hypothetical protein
MLPQRPRTRHTDPTTTPKQPMTNRWTAEAELQRLNCIVSYTLKHGISHDDPQWATTTHNEPQRPTASHNDPQRSQNDRQLQVFDCGSLWDHCCLVVSPCRLLLDCCGWLWIIVGSLWLVPCFSNYELWTSGPWMLRLFTQAIFCCNFWHRTMLW